jgi:hypothetical protein
MTYSIVDIEAAINHWRAVTPSPDGICLAPMLRALGDVYGGMIYLRASSVASSELTEIQRSAVETALDCLDREATK